MSGASLLILIFLGCTARLRYPGPLDSFTRYPDPPTTQPSSLPSTPSAGESSLLIGEDALPPRRRGAPGDLTGQAERVVLASVALLEQTRMTVDGEVYRHDCIGMVEAAYAMGLGLDLTSSIEDLYRQAQVLGIAHHAPLPHPGDVVFFDHSYDKNQNGRRDDPFTHVAVVEQVEADGTITMVHLGGRGKPVTRKNMNLLYPDATHSPEGKSWNDGLRSPQDQDGGPALTGQLFLGFGSFWAVTSADLQHAAQQVRAAQAAEAEAATEGAN